MDVLFINRKPIYTQTDLDYLDQVFRDYQNGQCTAFLAPYNTIDIDALRNLLQTQNIFISPEGQPYPNELQYRVEKQNYDNYRLNGGSRTFLDWRDNLGNDRPDLYKYEQYVANGGKSGYKDWINRQINRSAIVGSIDNAVFAQVKAKSTKEFSPAGIKKYSEIAGIPIKTVQDLTDALKSGRIKASDIPVDYVIINGQRVIANTRTSTALTNAGIPRSKWYGINRTGQKLPGNTTRTYDDNVRDQIRRNNGPIDPSNW